MSNSSEEHIQSDLYYTSKYEDVLLVMKGKISYYGTTILKLVRSIDLTSASIQLDSLASTAIFSSFFGFIKHLFFSRIIRQQLCSLCICLFTYYASITGVKQTPFHLKILLLNCCIHCLSVQLDLACMLGKFFLLFFLAMRFKVHQFVIAKKARSVAQAIHLVETEPIWWKSKSYHCSILSFISYVLQLSFTNSRHTTT